MKLERISMKLNNWKNDKGFLNQKIRDKIKKIAVGKFESKLEIYPGSWKGIRKTVNHEIL